MTYELWNLRSRSAIGGFGTEAEALAVVRAAVEDHGRGAVDHWLLGREDMSGRSTAIAQGQALAERALEAGSDQRSGASALPALT